MEVTKRLPAIRFNGFEDEWVEKKMGQTNTYFTDGNYGEAYPNGNEFSNMFSGIPFLKGSNLKNGKLKEKGAAYITKEKHGQLKTGHLFLDDIVLAVRGSLGSLGYVEKENVGWNINSQLAIIRTSKAELSGIFLLQFLLSIKGQFNLLSKVSGSALKQLPIKQLKDVFIPITSILEQTEIGNYFKGFDTLIQAQEQKLKKVTNLKKAMLEKMFPKENADVPEIRFKGFTEKWEKKKLGEIVDDLYNGQTPSRMVESFWNGNINWLSSGELNRGVVEKTIEKITIYGKKSANLRIVPNGTFVLAITGLEAAGTRGNCAILGIDTTMNQSCMAIYPNLSKLNTLFLFQWYRRFSEEIGIKYTQGTKQQSFNITIIKKLDITLPKIEEQQKIGSYFQNLDQLISQSQQKIKQLKNLKQALLQKMFI